MHIKEIIVFVHISGLILKMTDLQLKISTEKSASTKKLKLSTVKPVKYKKFQIPSKFRFFFMSFAGNIIT